MVRIAWIVLATWFLLACAAQAAAAPVGTPIPVDFRVTLGALENVPDGDGDLIFVSPTGESALVSRSREGFCFMSLWTDSEEVCQRDLPANIGKHRWSVDGSHIVFATDAAMAHGQDSNV